MQLHGTACIVHVCAPTVTPMLYIAEKGVQPCSLVKEVNKLLCEYNTF